MDKKIIAVFGGSFNPPINKHLKLAKKVVEAFNIEKLFFVPVSTRYKKAELASDTHRYNMLKIICKGEEKIDVSNIELTHKKQLYTVETLDLFKEKYGRKYDIYFVMGTDNLKQIDTWKEPERLFKEYKFFIIERGNDNINEIIKSNTILKKYKDSIVKVKGVEKNTIDSTTIRNMLREKKNIQEYIPEDVLAYIKENNLYKE